MNKKNITLILVGILLLVLQFNISVGPSRIDLFSDILAFVLIAVGGFPLAKRNVVFKKMKGIIILGLVLTTIAQLINLYNYFGAVSNINSIITGLSTIVAIYFTYYFTEGLILEAKFQDKSAVTRSFRITWFVLGALIFIEFIASTSDIMSLIIISQAVTGIFTIYFCSSVLTACNQLYMEGIPTKHMNM